MSKNKRVFGGLLTALLFSSFMSVTAAGDTPREIAKKVLPSVVLLVMEDANGKPIATASGFIISEGIIATNLHAIKGATRAHVKLSDKETKYNIRGVVASDPSRDLVLLAVDGIKAAPLPVGDSNKVAVGDTVYVAGNPQGLVGTFSDGIVSSIRKVGEISLLQITAPISLGSSGGPVVNTKGEVIGVVVATLKSGQNLNFVIPVNYLVTLLSSRGAVKPFENSKTPKNTREETSDFWKKFVESERKAAAQGDVNAMGLLGAMYSEGVGVPQDYSKAMIWYRKAAVKGDTDSMHDLGRMYSYGKGVSRNYSKAMIWYCKAADKGHAGAMHSLGLLLCAGDSMVPKDYRKAVRWFRKAAELGNVEAMPMLGVMYDEGVGVPQDHAEAYVWYSIASAFGYEKAEKKRDKIAGKLTPSVKLAAQSQASELFNKIQKRMAK